jgi:hypothetical protein
MASPIIILREHEGVLYDSIPMDSRLVVNNEAEFQVFR